MQKKAWLFLGGLIPASAIGALLRAIELRTSLDSATMLMDFHAVSLILLLFSALVLGLTGLLSRRTETALPIRYNRCFGGAGMLAVSGAALLLSAAGALLCLRQRSSLANMRLFLSLLALMGFLAGAAWLALGLDGWRRKKEDSFLSAVIPVFFCALFLIVFYKSYAQLPALLYTLYPFLGLCAALSALHLAAGCTLGRLRPRTTLFLCGAGCYLCCVSIPGVRELAFRLFFAALALELAAHGACLLLPREPEPEKKEEAETAPEGEEAGAAETEAAPEGEAPAGPEAGGAEDAKPE